MRALVFAALVALTATASALEAKAPGAEWKEANREDDLVIGIRSSAITFGRADRGIVGALQAELIVI